MTAVDRVLHELGTAVAVLDEQAKAVLYRACARALRPLYEQWLKDTGEPNFSSLLDRADLACEVAVSGEGLAHRLEGLLAELEIAMPPGDAIGDVSSTGAQSCWIAYDTSLRVLLDHSFRSDLCIEYVLQPILSGVSEELFGFSEVGSGPEEDAQMEELVADRRITEAVRWVRSACSVSPTDDLRPLPGRRHPLRP